MTLLVWRWLSENQEPTRIPIIILAYRNDETVEILGDPLIVLIEKAATKLFVEIRSIQSYKQDGWKHTTEDIFRRFWM